MRRADLVTVLGRIAESLETMVRLEQERMAQDAETVQQNAEIVTVLQKQGEYTAMLKQRAEEHELHRMTCPRCREHFYPEGRGN